MTRMSTPSDVDVDANVDRHLDQCGYLPVEVGERQTGEHIRRLR